MAKQKRRIRKKLHLDEFAVYGFIVSADCSQQDEGFEQFIDEFITYIESLGLMYGGGGDAEGYDIFVAARGRYDSPTEEQRQAVSSWIEGKCNKVIVSDFIDAFYA